MSLNDWAYTPEEQEQLEEEQNLENRILIEAEIDGTLQKVRAVDLQLDDLGRLARRIEQLGGMDRNVAQEAMVILPEFGERHRLNEFTTVPTNVKYQVSMEEIGLGMALGIGSAIAAVTALLYKFLKWLFGSSSKMTGGGGGGSITYKPGQGVEKIKENIEEAGEAVVEASQASEGIQEVNKELQRLLSRGLDFVHEGKVVTVRNVRDLADVVGENGLVEVGTRVKNLTDLDLATNGPIAQFFFKNLSRMKASLSGIKRSIVIIDNMSKVVEGINNLDETDMGDEDRKMAAFTKTIPLAGDLKVLDQINDILGDLEPLVSEMEKAGEESAIQSVDKGKLNYFEFLNGYVRFGEQFVRHKYYIELVDMYTDSVELAEEVYIKLEDLRGQVESIKDLPPEYIKQMTADIQKVVVKSNKVYVQQVKIMNFLQKVIGSYLNTIRTVAKVNESVYTKVFNKVIITDASEGAFDKWVQLLSKLRLMYEDFQHLEDVYKRRYFGETVGRTKTYDTMLAELIEIAKKRGKDVE